MTLESVVGILANLAEISAADHRSIARLAQTSVAVHAEIRAKSIAIHWYWWKKLEAALHSVAE